MRRKHKVMLCLVGAFCLCLAGFAVAPNATAESQSITWDYDAAADYTYIDEVIEVVPADSVARLVRLPDTELWVNRYLDTAAGDTAAEYNDCAIDQDGNVIVVGSAQTAANGTQMVINKYDRNGNQLPAPWPRQYSRGLAVPANEDNVAEKVIVDGNENITVAGYSANAAGDYDFTIWRFDSNGDAIPGTTWPVYEDPTGGLNDEAYSLIMDTDGNILAVGNAPAATHNRMYLNKYDTTGAQIWASPVIYARPANQNTEGFDIMQDSDGNYVIVGYGVDQATVTRDGMVIKYGMDGNPVWSNPIFWDGGVAGGAPDEFMGISQDRNGEYVVVGVSQTVTPTTDIVMNRYATDGSQVTGWPVLHTKDNTGPVPRSVWRGYVDTAGNTAFAYDDASAGTQDAYTDKYSSAGAELNALNYPRLYAGTGGTEEVHGCEVDGLDNIYTMGESDDTTTPPDDEAFIVKYPPGPYSTGRPSITTNNPVAYAQLEGFSETLGANNEGSVEYQLSPDGTTYYFFDGSRWTAATDKFMTNTAAEVDAYCPTFHKQVGSGNLYVRAFLVSDGTQQVELDAVTVRYNDTYTWYLAEGSTGNDANGGFETWVLLQNPSVTNTATAQITYQTPTGTTPGPTVTLNPGTRQTVDVSLTVTNEWSVSTTVTSDNPIICERAMYWHSANGVYRQAAHDSIGVTRTHDTWYLAEGSTGFDANGSFETWVLLQNPSTTDTATATINYQTPTGTVPLADPVVLDPGTRQTVNVAETVPNEWSVSTYVTSDIPIICERAMYWHSAAGIYRQAAHDSKGVTSTGLNWFLAEGSTGFDATGNFETWVLLQNPSATDTATATITYQTPTGAVPRTDPVVLNPGTRDTVSVAETVPNTWSVSTQVASDSPIICERAMYWNSSAGVFRQAAHDSCGVTNTGTTWYLAEGSTGADPNGNFETWVLLQNPSTTDTATATISYQTPIVSINRPDPVVLDPGTRDTVNVAETVPLEWSVSTTVTSDSPIICERAMYWNSTAGIVRQAAHDSIGWDP